MKKTFAFKAALIGKYGTQFQASRRLGIHPSRLSALCRGSDEPSERELKILSRALGEDLLRRVFEPAALDRQPEPARAAS